MTPLVDVCTYTPTLKCDPLVDVHTRLLLGDPLVDVHTRLLLGDPLVDVQCTYAPTRR